MKNLACVVLMVMTSSACHQDSGRDAEADFSAISNQLIEIEAVLSSGLPISTINQNYLEFFIDDLVLLPPGRRAIHGQEAALEFYNNAFGMLTALSVVYQQPEILVDGDLATRRYVGITKLQFGADSELRSGSGRYIDILQRQTDGSWLIAWHAMTPID